jgi:hypothetical protein
MIGTVFSLISFGIVAITTAVIFVCADFLLLTPPRQDMPATKMLHQRSSTMESDERRQLPL